MSKMDDIENALENNPELKQAVEREGQNLRDAGVEHSANDNTQSSNANDANTSDDAQLYRTPESDVGNMDGKQIPDSVKEQAASIMESQNIQQAETPTGEIGELSPSHPPEPSKVDSIDATPPDIPDSVKEQAIESKVDSIEGGQNVKSGEAIAPRDTPSVDKGGNDGLER
ncbi:hypothetical protein MNBD_GAMMA01-1375 [hydrothermal vent metagenome]|uniref:Uncharacterized protein n=1 Tax=hydrothermal vent metagenome TaxID=652676 RepID=A0A3B0VR79_9ZZZZ